MTGLKPVATKARWFQAIELVAEFRRTPGVAPPNRVGLNRTTPIGRLAFPRKSLVGGLIADIEELGLLLGS